MILSKLHGVPVLIKDTFNTLDEMGTTGKRMSGHDPKVKGGVDDLQPAPLL
jgi:Asp-tRNA(Asn)/Glu-tRNA(Gln) amidotransferase A subunit family amidase